MDLIEDKDLIKVKSKENEIIIIGFDESTIDLKYEELKREIIEEEYQLLEILTYEQYEENTYKVVN